MALEAKFHRRQGGKSTCAADLLFHLQRMDHYSSLYVSSSTGSNHSGFPAVMAMCSNQLSFVAPCQCFTPSWVTITSPAFKNFAGFPSSWYQPSPPVINKI